MDLGGNVQEWLISQNKFQNSQLSKRKVFSKKAYTVSITSGKGGVGKTSISVKMSKILAEWGYKVLLIDCDYNLSNTFVKLGIPINNNFLKYIKNEKDLDDCIYKEGNFHLLSGCNGNLELSGKKFFFENILFNIFYKKEREYDFIFLDCPAGISNENLIINAYCDFRFVIVTPDKSSITDSYSLIKILNKKHGVTKNHLLVNKVLYKVQFNKLVKSLSETVQKFLNCRLNILGGIVREKSSYESFDEILFLSEKTRLHKNFCNVLNKFTDEVIELPDNNMAQIPRVN
jgi:flagellar biosynthesis protein FlhG